MPNAQLPVNDGMPYGVLRVSASVTSIVAGFIVGIVYDASQEPNPTGTIYDNPSAASGLIAARIPLFQVGNPVIQWPAPGLQLLSGGFTVILDGNVLGDTGIQILYR